MLVSCNVQRRAAIARGVPTVARGATSEEYLLTRLAIFR
jgi:hypothetical protein